MSLKEHLIYQISNAPLRRYPFTHFFIDEVFPWDVYTTLIDTLESGSMAFRPLGFPHRQYCDELPPELAGLDGVRFPQAVISLFSDDFARRYPFSDRPEFTAEWRFIRDEEGYSIGPHTDAPHKVASLLFYLPSPAMYMSDLGTSIFVPTDHKKTCPGGPHHEFDGFEEVFRAPMRANSCFGFWKTNFSWHGVKKISGNVRRDVLLFNIYERPREDSPKIVTP